MSTGLPIVNIGKLMGMRRDRERTAFGQRLHDRRKTLKLTQTDVAKAAGISQTTLTELEWYGHGSSNTVALAKVLQCSPEWLATGEGPSEVGVVVLVDEAHRTQNQEEMDLLGAFRKLPASERQELVRDVMARAEALDEMVTRYLREKHNVTQFAESGKVAENISPAPVAAPAPRRNGVRGTSVFGELDELPASGAPKKQRGQ